MLFCLTYFDFKMACLGGQEAENSWLLKWAIAKTPAKGIYCDRGPVAVSGRVKREKTAAMTDVWVHCSTHSNKQKELPAFSALYYKPIRQFIRVAEPYSNAWCGHFSSRWYICGDARWCPHNSGLTGTMFGGIIHGTINMWLVDIEEEELW